MDHKKQRRQLPLFSEDGILLVDKPATWTSFDVVGFLRSNFNIPKIGHCGTLDPAATGLLVIVIGKFTKLSEKFSGEDKTYDADIMFGIETDSMDMDGKILSEHQIEHFDNEKVKNTISSYVGTIQQIPPMVSAIKQNGTRLYSLARQGIEVERQPRTITIERIDITEIKPPHTQITVKCSKGTYIRALCSDIGKDVGYGAALHSLRRTQSGMFQLLDAVTIDTIKSWSQDDLSAHLQQFWADKLKSFNTQVDGVICR
jgi:tRNA pseudouridine55 synthase